MGRTSRWHALCALTVTAMIAPVAAAAASPMRSPRSPAPMACKKVSPDGRELSCAVALPAGVKVRSANVRVLLPADYARTKRPYPVVFMLHGVGDDETAWTNPQRGDLARLTASCRAIFVMPDGGSGPVAGWYSDWVDNSFQYETFHTRVLPAAIDATFRTTGKGRRAVAGMSMGGFGALSYAARHRGLFKAAASYSGFVDTMFGAPVSGESYDIQGQNPVFSLGTPSRRVWGTQGSTPEVWRAHNPYDQAAALAGVAVFLASGTGTPGGPQGDNPAMAANYGSESYVGHLNDRFAARLQEVGVPFSDGRYLGGYHDWVYWRAAFTASLPVLMPPVAAASRGCGS
ncbi:MAG TPA: alpha/beta hydrolase family protein [Mycobacteriales bacterium]|nr:alpha/beta hydrolase family protein [Mycobacteriales bacterium]